MARPISIYRSLLISLLLVIAVLSGCILVATWVQARGAVEAVSQAAILRTVEEVDARLQGYFEPPKRVLQLMRDWGEQGRLQFADVDAFSASLGPVIENYPQITSLMLADEAGREQMLLLSGQKWITRDSRADEWGRTTHWTERASLSDSPKRSTKEIDYDCRKRPWYQQAVLEREGAAARETQWTKPYKFFTTQELGITASVGFETPTRRTRVLAYDVLLRDITQFTRLLAPSANGMTVVITDEWRVLGLPGIRRFEDTELSKQALLEPADSIGVAVLADTLVEFRSSGSRAAKPFRVESGGAAWWAGVRWIDLSSDRRLGVVVMVPESDLLGEAVQRRLWILLATAFSLAFAAWYAMVLARRYSRPIRELVGETARIEAGDLSAGEPIRTRLLEVRALGRAHERMRIAVGTLLKLERDIQIAKQIQQDTFPGRLPELPGYELDAWSYPADETGGDTYDLVGLRRAAAEGAETTLVVQEEAENALLLLADATGHGIGPALSVTQVRAMLRMAARSGASLASIASHMNEQLYSDLADDRFITAWIGVLDSRAHELTSFSAGQAPLLHFVAARDEVVTMGSDTPPFGIIENLPVRIKPSIVLGEGDLFVVLSDGIYEAKNARREEFGTERVIEVLRARRACTPREILDALRAELAIFTGDEPQDDDRTAILIKRCNA